MADIVFREAPVPAVESPKLPDVALNNQQVMTGESDREPVEIREAEGKSVVLDALGIHDDVASLPDEDKGNLTEVKNYVLGIMKSKGLSPTVDTFTKTLHSLKSDMGLDAEAEPSIVLDRIAGVVKAWRNLSFIKDPTEKKKILFKLAKLNSSAEMNKEVFRVMENYSVWQ